VHEQANHDGSILGRMSEISEFKMAKLFGNYSAMLRTWLAELLSLVQDAQESRISGAIQKGWL
jgi:hypothetical protein